MEIVIARVRLLEILVESPPRVNAAWLRRVPPANPLLLPLQVNNCHNAPMRQMIHMLKS